MTERRKRRSIFDIISDYFESLEEHMEELRMALEQPSWDPRSCSLEPLCNIFITADEVLVTADLPYADTESIEVKPLTDELIEIKAKMNRTVRFHDFGITYRNGEFHTFYCQTRIPVPVQMNKMSVSFKRGILEVRLPRKRGYPIKVE